MSASETSATVDPELAVVLPVSAWNTTLAILGRASFEEVARLIFAINGQLAQQLEVAVAKAQAAAADAAGTVQ